MNTQKLKAAILKIKNECSNMMEIESVIFQAGIDCFGRLNSKDDQEYDKLIRVLFITIPERFKHTSMYKKLYKRTFKIETVESKWDSLPNNHKRSFGDRIVINASDLQAWAKPYSELSDHKKKMVDRYIMDTEVEDLNHVIS